MKNSPRYGVDELLFSLDVSDLPEEIAKVGRPVTILAMRMVDELPENDHLRLALEHLVYAQNLLMRASLYS